MTDDASAKLRGPIAWMARNGVAANLLMLILLVGGAVWATRIKQEFFPLGNLSGAQTGDSGVVCRVP
jgi:hypothetical protein